MHTDVGPLSMFERGSQTRWSQGAEPTSWSHLSRSHFFLRRSVNSERLCTSRTWGPSKSSKSTCSTKKKTCKSHFLKRSCDHTDVHPVVLTLTVSGSLLELPSVDAKPLSICLHIISSRRRSENRKRVPFLPLWPRRHSSEDQLSAAPQKVQEQEVRRNLEAVFSVFQSQHFDVFYLMSLFCVLFCFFNAYM